ncbi:MAG: tetratricopeptide repeat protein [Pyrinomonadaceae bacterium]
MSTTSICFDGNAEIPNLPEHSPFPCNVLARSRMLHTARCLAVTQNAAIANSEERERGLALYRQGKFNEASKVFRKAVDKNRADCEGWYHLGVALLQQPKEIKNASRAFETALKLKPNFAAAHAGLSYTLLARNKSSEAIREANAALSIDPRIVDAHYVIGVAHLRAGAKEEAVQRAETLISLDPRFAPAYLLKSQALTIFFEDAMVLPKPGNHLKFAKLAIGKQLRR